MSSGFQGVFPTPAVIILSQGCPNLFLASCRPVGLHRNPNMTNQILLKQLNDLLLVNKASFLGVTVKTFFLYLQEQVWD